MKKKRKRFVCFYRVHAKEPRRPGRERVGCYDSYDHAIDRCWQQMYTIRPISPQSQTRVFNDQVSGRNCCCCCSSSPSSLLRGRAPRFTAKSACSRAHRGQCRETPFRPPGAPHRGTLQPRVVAGGQRCNGITRSPDRSGARLDGRTTYTRVWSYTHGSLSAAWFPRPIDRGRPPVPSRTRLRSPGVISLCRPREMREEWSKNKERKKKLSSRRRGSITVRADHRGHTVPRLSRVRVTSTAAAAAAVVVGR